MIGGTSGAEERELRVWHRGSNMVAVESTVTDDSCSTLNYGALA